MFNKELFLNETYKIKITDSVKLKLEDGAKNKEPLLIDIRASSLGRVNKNNVLYRHDTVRDDIVSYVYPSPKPIIRDHDPKGSAIYGRVIAADYKETNYYNEFINKRIKLEDLSSEEYMQLCKDIILPYQDKNPNYNGLAYVSVIGKIDNEKGIKKILDSEFLYVSIGAKPLKLICSECGQDQTIKICDHYLNRKKNNIFMLAEELEYEELSFVEKPADKFGKITYIHDGYEYESEPINIEADVDIILAKDFFKQAEGKKIVCTDNICTVINEPEVKMRKKEGQKVLNVSYVDEFGVEQLADIKLSDSEDFNIEDTLKLSDEVMGELTNRDFAIVQKTEEGLKRRFPIHNAENTKAAVQLINKAEDLTDQEKEKAITAISKSAKKQGIDFKLQDKESKESSINSFDEAIALIKDSIEKVEFEETEDGTVTFKDSEKTNPVNEVFNMLVSFSGNLKWASNCLNDQINGYLIQCGKEAHDKGLFDSAQEDNVKLKDSVAQLEDEIAELEEQTRELNYAMRINLVDDIISCKQKLELIDSEDEEKKSLLKLSYENLIKQKQDFDKLVNKLKDSTISNTSNIKTIQNPTLNDEDSGSDKQEGTATLEDSEKENSNLSDKEIVHLFRNLFKRNA